MSPSSIAILCALVAVFGGLVAIFASRASTRTRRSAAAGAVTGGHATSARHDGHDTGADAGGGSDGGGGGGD